MWSVIFNVTTAIVCSSMNSAHCEMANLINKCCLCSGCPTPKLALLPSLFLLGAPCSPVQYWEDTTEIRPINNHISYFKSKPEMINFSEEGRSKAKIECWASCAKQPRNECIGKFWKKDKSATPMKTWMIRQGNSHIADIEKILVSG